MGRPRKRQVEKIIEDQRDTKTKRTKKIVAKIVEEEEVDLTEEEKDDINPESTTLVTTQAKKIKQATPSSDLSFIGKPIPELEARKKWPLRYQSKGKEKKQAAAGSNNTGESNGDEEVMQAKCHYKQAMVDGVVYNLGDDTYVKAEDGDLDYIARILELFESTHKELYFKAQWFYRAQDTVIKDRFDESEKRRVFLSDIKNDNPLNCIIRKVKIAQVQPNMDLEAKMNALPPCELYYDMKYTLPFLTFESLDKVNSNRDSDESTISSESGSNSSTCDNDSTAVESVKINKSKNSEVFLLDLYSGCGTMSTGLCIGAALSGIKLVTKWAVDINQSACKSLKMNHPETEVRNEAADDFLSLLKEWEKLCHKFSLIASDKFPEQSVSDNEDEEEDAKDDNEANDSEVPGEEFEVERFLAICYGDPNNVKEPGLYLKVRWLGYGPSYDTWEPIGGLSNCKEKIKDFVTKGYKSNMLPLPGTVDFICGGPPCQGISGFNRFRDTKAPLEDTKNRQLLVFMNIIEFLQPIYVLMENVVDILRFAGGYLARYAVGRLVSMNYQTRLGMMAAGSYGVPQFRMRVFLWGANPSRKLPPYPLPTHKIDGKGLGANEFEEIVVAYDKKQPCQLEEAIYLNDILSDLPPVSNGESQDERKYESNFKTEFQKYIRLKKNKIISFQDTMKPQMLYDHRPYQLNKDDLERVCLVPKKKGANFRNLSGVLVGADKKVFLDPSIERPLVKSGKPLVPDYAISFKNGKSTEPFGRLWWDEIVNTVVTRAQPHNRTLIHPNQDRVLTIRENARIQGFPDCYQLQGPVKERYIQVGNAVAVPVALALGYAFGNAWQELSDDQPLMNLPFKFPNCLALSSLAPMEADKSD